MVGEGSVKGGGGCRGDGMGVGVDEGGGRCRLELIDRSRRLSATARRIALSMPELSRHIAVSAHYISQDFPDSHNPPPPPLPTPSPPSPSPPGHRRLKIVATPTISLLGMLSKVHVKALGRSKYKCTFFSRCQEIRGHYFCKFQSPPPPPPTHPPTPVIVVCI